MFGLTLYRSVMDVKGSASAKRGQGTGNTGQTAATKRRLYIMTKVFHSQMAGEDESINISYGYFLHSVHTEVTVV